jgi:phage gp36-like protein
MGKYTNAINLRKLYKDIDTTGLVDNDVEFFIKQKETIIDLKLAQRYTLPFSSTPPIIETIASECSFIGILDRYFTGETNSKNDWREVRATACNSILDALSDGSLTLVDSGGEIISQRTDIGGIQSNTSGYEPTFNRLNETLQREDPDRLDDTYNDVSDGLEYY